MPKIATISEVRERKYPKQEDSAIAGNAAGEWGWRFHRQGSGWGNHSFSGNKWQNIRAPERKAYQINA